MKYDLILFSPIVTKIWKYIYNNSQILSYEVGIIID